MQNCKSNMKRKLNKWKSFFALSAEEMKMGNDILFHKKAKDVKQNTFNIRLKETSFYLIRPLPESLQCDHGQIICHPIDKLSLS